MGSVILARTLNLAIEQELYSDLEAWVLKLEESAVIKWGKPYNTFRVVSLEGL